MSLFVLVASLALAAAAHAVTLSEAVAECDSCHGKDGASSEPTVPIIGSYSAFYTEGRLIAYRNGETSCPEATYVSGAKKGEKSNMCEVAKALDEGVIKQLAEHYAGKPFVRAKQAFDPALAEAGAKIQKRHCGKCHEEDGSLPDSDAGILAGQWIPYMRSAFKEYDEGKRPMPEKMKPKYDRLDAKEKEAIIQFYASFQ